MVIRFPSFLPPVLPDPSLKMRSPQIVDTIDTIDTKFSIGKMDTIDGAKLVTARLGIAPPLRSSAPVIDVSGSG
jgi:hypothetical protein